MGNLNLPQGFDRVELSNMSLGHAKEILEYCSSCTKKDSCVMNKNLRFSIGNGGFYWNDKFVAINVPNPYRFSSDNMTKRLLCIDYESPQAKLPGIPRAYSDGVEKLIEIIEEEKAYCNELEAEYDKDAFFKNLSFKV